ncbi:MAG: MerR family DNA-binding transcriptional regulator [Candidatus Pacebacteria bacterium]|nr:MerR family DNA-binding transcriptional regulator [Candidatus Paceibacterota bacterium]
MTKNKLYINIKEASEMLGVTPLTLRNWDKSGKLSARRHPISNYRVYLREDIDKLINRMESGEKPTPRPTKAKKEVAEDKPKIFNLKVLHLRD